MPHDPFERDPKRPPTRMVQSWSFFWQVYRNNLPRKLDKANMLLRAAQHRMKK